MSLLVEFPIDEVYQEDYFVVVNNNNIGTLDKSIDGFYNFYLESGNGYIPSWVLRAIADKLDELNKDWEATIAKELHQCDNSGK